MSACIAIVPNPLPPSLWWNKLSPNGQEKWGFQFFVMMVEDVTEKGWVGLKNGDERKTVIKIAEQDVFFKLQKFKTEFQD